MAVKDILKLAKDGSKAGDFYKKGGNWYAKGTPTLDNDDYLGVVSSDSDFLNIAKVAGRNAGAVNKAYDYSNGVAFVYDDVLFTLNYQNETRYGDRYILSAREATSGKFKEFVIYDKYENHNSFSKWIKSNCDYRMPEILESGIQKSKIKDIEAKVINQDFLMHSNNDMKEVIRAIEKDKSKIILENELKTEIKKTSNKRANTKPKAQINMKPIKTNLGIERFYKNALNAFNAEMIKSIRYWSVAQINKANRGEIKNVSNALKIEFNELLKVWNDKAIAFGKKINEIIEKRVKEYVDNAFIKQNPNFKLTKIGTASNQSLKAILLQNMSLIKSIPQEIIKKYEITLYNQIDNYDAHSLTKQLQRISKVSKARIKTIARNQIAKATEAYSSARAQDLGFEYYVWNTSKDERVSTGEGGHRVLEGRIYAYNKPSAIIDVMGTKGHPAQRVNCRCIATPLFLEPNQELKLVRDEKAGDFFEIIKK